MLRISAGAYLTFLALGGRLFEGRRLFEGGTYTIASISISNHMAVRVIWDISPELFFINFEIIPSVSEGDFEIDKKQQG